jgi:hypothetical protein
MIKYKSNSRENQDLFVLCVLDKKVDGIYVEVGSAWPIKDNNTYLLESEFNWQGVSFDNDYSFANEFNNVRKNQCVLADATELDYNYIFEECGLPTHIDYLQLDIDPPHNTFKVLNKIDFNKYSFSVITYEHDFSSGGKEERIKSRQILESYGYTRVISDVMHGDIIFEDWYVNEKYMPNDNWKEFIGENIPMDIESINEKYNNIFIKLLK